MAIYVAIYTYVYTGLDTVHKITLETWDDTLSGHDKVCANITGVVQKNN